MTLVLLLLLSFLSESQSEVKLIRENGKVGMTDAAGRLLIPAIYDDLGWSSGNFTPLEDVIGFKQQGLWGLISTSGKQISEARYVSLQPTNESNIIAGLKARFSNKVLFGILNTHGNPQIGFQYASISVSGSQYIVAQTVNAEIRKGLIDQKERRLIPIVHREVKWISPELLAVTATSGKTALFNKEGKAITPFVIDGYTPVPNDYYTFTSEGHVGLFDHLGKIRLPAEFKSLTMVDASTVNVREYDRWEAYSGSKESVFSVMGDTIVPVAHNLLLTYSGHQGRLFDTQGSLRDSLFYQQIIPLDSSLLLVKKDNAYGVRSVSGTSIIGYAYDTIIYANPFFYTHSSEGWYIYNKFGRKLTTRPQADLLPEGELLIAAREDRYWGYIDYTGKVSIAYQYDEVQPFVGKYAVVRYLGGYGVINSFGDWVVTPSHEKIEIIAPQLFLIQNGELKQLRNDRGEVVFETYNAIIDHPVGLVEKNASGKLGFIDPKGNAKLRLEYDSISNVLSGKYVILIREGYYSLITLNGKIIIPDYSQFEKIFPFTQEFIGMQKDGKYGYFDLEGRLRIANQYEMVGIWQENRGPVMLKGKWGFVDDQERLVIQPYYDKVSPFVDGISIAQKGLRYGLLDKDGNEVVAFDSDRIERLPSGNYLIYKGDKLGLATSGGRQSLATIYDYLDELTPDLYHVKRRGKSGVKDAGNVDIIALSYDNIAYDPINRLLFTKTTGEQRTMTLR